MTTPDSRERRWTRVEYDRLIDAGVFQPGEPIELLGGLLVVAEPQGDAHFTAIRLAEDALRATFGPGWEVRPQGPIALDAESEPEPDVAVVPGTARDYREGHPTHAVLVVEVHREPGPEPAAPFGWRYQSVTTVGPEGSVIPLAAHGTPIPVADLLP